MIKAKASFCSCPNMLSSVWVFINKKRKTVFLRTRNSRLAKNQYACGTARDWRPAARQRKLVKQLFGRLESACCTDNTLMTEKILGRLNSTSERRILTLSAGFLHWCWTNDSHSIVFLHKGRLSSFFKSSIEFLAPGSFFCRFPPTFEVFWGQERWVTAKDTSNQLFSTLFLLSNPEQID